MHKPIVIVANGQIKDSVWFKTSVQQEAEAVIGVDGGVNHLLDIDIMPDIVIGDMDSISNEYVQVLEENWVNIFRFSQEKDETDLELALVYVADQAAWKSAPIHLYGALGGRLDHEIANLMLLTHSKLSNCNIRLMSPHQTTFLIRDTADVYGRTGDTVSLIPLKGDANIQQTENLKWPLINSILKFGPARGVSNQMIASSCKIVVESGLVLCIHTTHQWNR